jgi:hypothetical protein
MDLSGATELYLLQRSRVPLLLIPDSAGTPTVLSPQPLLLRASYVSPNDVEAGLSRAARELASDNCWLFAPISCPDGPPNRSVLLFVLQQKINGISWRDGTIISHGDTMLQYRPATLQGPWQWLSDARQGRSGYFLTGTMAGDSLWRVFRLEPDAFHRAVFTLAPLRVSSGCPQANFSTLNDTLLASEIAAQYRDLGRAVVAYGYRDVVTKARNIVEGLVSARLKAAGHPHGRDLFTDLKTVKSLLEDTKSRDSCGWTQLEYHLAHKIRLVHGETHATQTAKTARALRPEFAFSVVEDLIELLTIWGFCKT